MGTNSMSNRMGTAAVTLGLLAASPAVAVDDPSTKGTTVDIFNYAGVMNSGVKGEKEMADMVLYYQLAAQTLIPLLEMPNMCPEVKSDIAVAPGKTAPDWRSSIPVETRILTHYTDKSKRVVIGHTANAVLGSADATYVFNVSAPGAEACLDATLDGANKVFKQIDNGTDASVACNFHADLMVEQPRSVAIFANCGPSALPNNPTYDPHYYHHPGTTPKAR